MGGQGKRRLQEEAFSARYDSRVGRRLRTKKEGNPMMGAASETKNDRFIRHLGGEPAPDARVSGSKISHAGKYGAPSIYYEKPGGRRGGRGKRTY